MHFFVTGHTGFKGAWLALLLNELGHEVSGFSLDPLPGCLYETGEVGQYMSNDFRGDIRDLAELTSAFTSCEPDILIHMAAQPLVRESYRQPRLTFETNVIGTMNVLEAASATKSLRAQIIVTTDKVYRNVHQRQGYREMDPLGGQDPYSASKAMADILTNSWTSSFAGPPTATARAGNVIGGGDISPERLVPDVMRALADNQAPMLRNPNSVRPWQHVLDCLSGYLALVPYLLRVTEGEQGFRGAWNFGPDPESMATVGEVTEHLINAWGATQTWRPSGSDNLSESELLMLDSSRAQQDLGWQNQLNLAESINWTADWYRAVADGGSALEISQAQIREFIQK